MSSLSVPAQASTHEWATHISLIPACPGGLCAGLSPCRAAHCHTLPAGCTFHRNSPMQEQLHAGDRYCRNSSVQEILQEQPHAGAAPGACWSPLPCSGLSTGTTTLRATPSSHPQQQHQPSELVCCARGRSSAQSRDPLAKREQGPGCSREGSQFIGRALRARCRQQQPQLITHDALAEPIPTGSRSRDRQGQHTLRLLGQHHPQLLERVGFRLVLPAAMP